MEIYMLSQDDTSKLWKLIEPINTGMLGNWNGEFLHSRPMQLVQDEFTGALYFFTHKSDSKVEEILKNREVNVTFSDQNENTYVSVSGVTTLVSDQPTIDHYWNDVVAAWFPEGKDDPDCVLLKVDTYLAQYWDSSSSKLIQLYKIAKANIKDETPDMGSNKKLS